METGLEMEEERERKSGICEGSKEKRKCEMHGRNMKSKAKKE